MAEREVRYDEAAVKPLFERCLADARANTVRNVRDRADLLNLMFKRGGASNQWVVFDNATNAFVERPRDGDAGLPGWFPRCVTNHFSRNIDGIASVMDQSSPALEWKPSTNDDADLATAEVCEDAIPVFLDEIDYDTLRSRIHALITLTDKVAVCYYYDADPKYGMSVIQLLRCGACGAEASPMEIEDADDTCPKCGAPADQMEPVIDAQARPVGMEYPVGKMCAELHLGYEFSLPSSARYADEEMVPWVLTHRRYSTEDAMRLWPKFKEKIKAASDAHGAGDGGLYGQYADQVARLAGPTVAHAYYGGGIVKGPIVYGIYHDPIEDDDAYFPDGLYAVMINETIVEATALPVKDDKDQPKKPVLIRTFMDSPGSPFGKPPSDDLVPIQVKFNLYDSLILAILMHDASPTKYIPLTVQLEDEPKGHPGETVRFRSLVPGERPFVERGVNPPEGLYKAKEMCEQEFEKISGLNAVMLGQRPEGDPTLGEIQILNERAQASFKGPIDRLIKFELRQARLLLQMGRQSAWSPRFRQIMGQDGQWQVKQFSGADLSGKVDVFCEPSSAWPKSQLMEQLKLKELAQFGVIMPAQDPELRVKLLSKYGMSDLKGSLDVDHKQIMRELDRWRANIVRPPKPPPVIDAEMHLFYKTMFLKSEEAEQLEAVNPQAYQAMVAHVQQLQAFLQPPATPTGPNGEALTGAIDAGALQPAGAQGDPMQRAIDSQALRPAQAPVDPMGGAVDAGALTPAMPLPDPMAGAIDAGALLPAGALPGPTIDDLVAQQAMTPVPSTHAPTNGAGGY